MRSLFRQWWCCGVHAARPFISLLVLTFVPSLADATTGWQRIATHPGAAAQPTRIGRNIASLHYVGGRIYSGYGDYGKNTGPIKIYAYVPRLRRLQYQGLTLQTEAILAYRNVGRRVYAIGADLRGTSPHQFAVRQRNWALATNIDSSSGSAGIAHIYDIVQWRKQLWVAGSMVNGHAGLWRSSDGGRSWKVALDRPSSEATAGGVARFYFIGIYRDKLFVQVSDHCSSGNCGSMSSMNFDGRRWRRGPNLLPFGGTGYPADQFANSMVMRNYENSYYAQRLQAFDGRRVRDPMPAKQWVHDYAIAADGNLYVLTANYRRSDGEYRQAILRSKDLQVWDCVFLAPKSGNARSISVAPSRTTPRNMVVYIGTTNSTIIARRIVDASRCPTVRGSSASGANAL